MKKTFDVAVIGSGVIGSWAAYHAARAGCATLLVEQFDTLHRRGSSHGESRITRRTYPQPYYTDLMDAAYQWWDVAEKEASTQLFTKTGGFDFLVRNSSDHECLIKSCERLGVEYTEMDKGQLLKEHGVHLPEDYACVHQRDAGVLNATKCVATVQFLAKTRGCSIVDHAPVAAVTPIKDGAEGYHIETAKGTFEAKKETTLECEAFLRALPVFIDYGNGSKPEVYGTPQREYGGLVKLGLHAGRVATADTRDYVPDWSSIERYLKPWVKSRLPWLDPEPVTTETCLYTLTPDHDFIVDKVPERPNAVIGAGFSGHGFKLGGVVGEMLVELALEGATKYKEVEHLRLQRLFN